MKRKKIYLLVILILFLSVSIGYAISSWNMQTLSIHSDISLVGSDWNIKMSPIENDLENITNVTVEKSTNTLTKTKYKFDVKLKDINDEYTFDINLENVGKNDGEIESVIYYIDDILIKKFSKEENIINEYLQDDYLDFKVTYWDGIELNPGDLIKVLTNDKLTAKVKYMFNESIDYSAVDKDVSLSFEINYKQKTTTAKERNHGLKENVKLGDYLSIDPFNNESTNNVVTLSTSETGLDEESTITLENFNTWRVINIDNENNKIELVSNYVSTNVYNLKGEVGYKNIGSINKKISDKYSLDNELIESARLFGFNGQKEVLDSLNDEANNEQLYETDYALITTSIETLIATNESGLTSPYGVSSRYKDDDTYGVYILNNSGILEKVPLVGENEEEIGLNYRVIITIDSNKIVKNDGTSATPFIIE